MYVLLHRNNFLIAQVLGAAFSADGTKVATAGRDKIVRVFDARSGDLLHVSLIII